MLGDFIDRFHTLLALMRLSYRLSILSLTLLHIGLETGEMAQFLRTEKSLKLEINYGSEKVKREPPQVRC